MSRLYEELAERIRGEAADLDRLVQRALRAWNRCRKVSSEQEISLSKQLELVDA